MKAKKTQSFEQWLKMKLCCPKCNAKDRDMLYVHCFVSLKAFFKCGSCGNEWDHEDLGV